MFWYGNKGFRGQWSSVSNVSEAEAQSKVHIGELTVVVKVIIRDLILAASVDWWGQKACLSEQS